MAGAIAVAAATWVFLRLERVKCWCIGREPVVLGLLKMALRRLRESALSVRRRVSAAARVAAVWRVAVLAARLTVRLTLEAMRAVCR